MMRTESQHVADARSFSPRPEPPWARRCRRIAESSLFQRAVLAAIVIAGLLTGLETYPALMERFGETIRRLDALILAGFVVELIIRLAAYGRRPWRFFADGWNVFDFVIVALCLLPIGGNQAAITRLVRLLRVFRLFSGVPRLRLVVTAMVRAVPSIGYVGLLMLLLFYIYGVIGTTLFGRNDPAHFGDLHTTMLNLLRIVTLEDWTDLMYAQIYGTHVVGYESALVRLSPAERELWQPQAFPIVGTIYFVTFVLIGTMIVLNLFVGVVLSSLTETQAEQARAAITSRRSGGELELDVELRRLEEQIGSLQKTVETLRTNLHATRNGGCS